MQDSTAALHQHHADLERRRHPYQRAELENAISAPKPYVQLPRVSGAS